MPHATGERPLKEVGPLALVEAFAAVLKRQKPEVRHRVLLESVSLRERACFRALVEASGSPVLLRSFDALSWPMCGLLVPLPAWGVLAQLLERRSCGAARALVHEALGQARRTLPERAHLPLPVVAATA